MELQNIREIEKQAHKKSGAELTRIGVALFFLVLVMLYSFSVSGGVPESLFLAIATVFGAYMAMNIGANDVANNVGPAVGSKALTMGGAILIAMIFEASGAIIAGGDVVSTIKKGIIDIEGFNGDTQTFVWAMMAALLAAALWLNLATYAKAPVSTTHSIVGGVMGAGIAAAGFEIVDWGTMGAIASSWVISPVIGALIAAIFLFAIEKTIISAENKIEASKKWVPIYVAIMAWAFVTYIVLKGLKKIWPQLIEFLNSLLPITMEVVKKPTFLQAIVIGLTVGLLVYLLMKKRVRSRQDRLQNNRESVNLLFTVPLIFAAALLSFAHGANDVANAIGPLAAIYDGVMTGGIHSKAGIPLWIMAVGALGIALGLGLYGPRLIRTVGGEITELDQVRAFSIAMAASITVIIASQLGLPVSSTHIAIGGVFGVGFLREWLSKKDHLIQEIEQDKKELADEKDLLNALSRELEDLLDKPDKDADDYQRITDLYRAIEKEENVLKRVKKTLKKEKKNLFVKREIVKKIITAWLITVPAAAVVSACLYYMIRGALV